MGTSIAILCGKGGVGKSMLTAGLGMRLAHAGKRVTLVDMSMGLRCLDMLLGLHSRVGFDLGDVLSGQAGLDAALVTDRQSGVRLLAAPQFSDGSGLSQAAFTAILDVLRDQCDYVLLDTPPAFAPGFALAAQAAGESLLLTTPDDICLRDAERTAAILRDMQRPAPALVINRIDPALVDAGLQYAPEVCEQVLDMRALGILPEDGQAARQSLALTPALEGTRVAGAIDSLIARMADRKAPAYDWRQAAPASPTEPPARRGFFARLRKR